MLPAPVGSESTGCLAVVRGGASGRLGLSETSASGAAAIALPTSAGRCNRDRTPFATISESLRNSPRCSPPARRCLPPQLAMLEHLSSLPTQMVRVGPASAQRSSHATFGSFAALVRDPPAASLFLARTAALHCLAHIVFPGPRPLLLRQNLPACASLGCFIFPPGNPAFHFLPRSLGVVADVWVALCQSCEARAGIVPLRWWNQFLLCSSSPLGLQGPEAS